MGKEEIKTDIDRVVEFVAQKQGCKAMVVAADGHLAQACNQSICDIIEEAVREKRLVEVEYTLPLMSYRIKSFLLPIGSEVHVRRATQTGL